MNSQTTYLGCLRVNLNVNVATKYVIDGPININKG